VPGHCCTTLRRLRLFSDDLSETVPGSCFLALSFRQRITEAINWNEDEGGSCHEVSKTCFRPIARSCDPSSEASWPWNLDLDLTQGVQCFADAALELLYSRLIYRKKTAHSGHCKSLQSLESYGETSLDVKGRRQPVLASPEAYDCRTLMKVSLSIHLSLWRKGWGCIEISFRAELRHGHFFPGWIRKMLY
jgi:hypothetical protein